MRCAQASVVRPLYRSALARLGLEPLGGGGGGGGGALLRRPRLSSSSDADVGEEATAPRRAAPSNELSNELWSPAALGAVWGLVRVRVS